MASAGGIVSAALGGALVGAITGYLVKKEKGAGYGAALGGISLALVTALATSGSPSTTGTGAPLGPGEHNPQLTPR